MLYQAEYLQSWEYYVDKRTDTNYYIKCDSNCEYYKCSTKLLNVYTDYTFTILNKRIKEKEQRQRKGKAGKTSPFLFQLLGVIFLIH